MNHPSLFDTPETTPALNLGRRRRPPRKHPYAHLDSHGGRSIRTGWCPTCDTPTLTGIDEDVLAFTVHTDAQPLDPTGEMLAWLSTPPRPTYTLDNLFHPARLTRRRASSLTHRPAGPRPGPLTWDVVAEHRCLSPLPACPSNLPETLEDPHRACPF